MFLFFEACKIESSCDQVVENKLIKNNNKLIIRNGIFIKHMYNLVWEVEINMPKNKSDLIINNIFVVIFDLHYKHSDR